MYNLQQYETMHMQLAHSIVLILFPVPGVEQFSPMYPAGHWQVLFGMQTPIPHGGSQTTVGKQKSLIVQLIQRIH